MATLVKNSPDWQRFYGNVGLWKNTLDPKDECTISTIDRYHEEQPFQVSEHYAVRICHVRGFPHGRGFMPSISSRFGDRGNGNAYWGTDQAAYDKAVADGREMLAKREKEWEEQNRQYFPEEYLLPSQWKIVIVKKNRKIAANTQRNLQVLFDKNQACLSNGYGYHLSRNKNVIVIDYWTKGSSALAAVSIQKAKVQMLKFLRSRKYAAEVRIEPTLLRCI